MARFRTRLGGLIAVAQRLRACVSGSIVVEAAVVLPILLTFGFGTFEAGKAMWLLNSFQYAVEDAARCAAIDTTTCDTDAHIKDKAHLSVLTMTGIDIPASEFSYDGSATCGKQVSITHDYLQVSATGFLSHYNPSLSASSCHP